MIDQIGSNKYAQNKSYVFNLLLPLYGTLQATPGDITPTKLFKIA